MKNGDRQKVSKAIRVSVTAVSNFAARLKSGEPPHKIVRSKKLGNSNAHSYNNEDLVKKLSKIPFNKRGTVRDVAAGLGVSTKKVYDLIRLEKGARNVQ